MKTVVVDIEKQQGVAAIMFVMMLPVLIGMLVLGVDGANFLRAKAHVGDAMELASLALSAKGSDDNVVNQRLVRNFIKAQFPLVKDKDITVDIIPTACKEIDGCSSSNDWGTTDLSYVQYDLIGSVKIPSLFSGVIGSSFGFDDEIPVGGKSISRKYQSPSVDIFLVADFSPSMNSAMAGDSSSKFTRLQKIVKDIEDIVKKSSGAWSSTNTITLVPFNDATRNSNGGCAITQLKYIRPVTLDVSSYQIDYKQTLLSLFEEKTCFYNQLEVNRIKRPEDPVTMFPNLRASGDNYIVTHSDDVGHLWNEIMTMNARKGSTYSFEGIIRAAQIAKKTTNPNRLIIILSDGEDFGKRIFNKSNGVDDAYIVQHNVNKIHRKLINRKIPGSQERGYCTAIRNEFSNLTVSSSERCGSDSQDASCSSGVESTPVKLKLAVIGFDYDNEKNVHLENCVGSENIYFANDMDSVKSHFLKLISEEVGTTYSEYDEGEEGS